MNARTLRAAAFALCLPLVAATAAAQAWPTKPVRLVTPFPAGSTVDTMARVIAPPLGELLGQQIVVENKGGAGGNLGVDAVAKAAPDGHTFGIATTGPMVLNPHLMARMPYDAQKDVIPVGQIASGPNVLAVNADVPAKTLAELLALARRQPGQLSYGSAGIGSTGHLAGELLASRAGVTLLHVPYRGNQEAMTDLLGGRIQIVFSGLPPLLGAVQSGRLRVLAVAGDQRLPSLPDVPTVAEAGLEGAEVMPWYGVIAPAGTSAGVVARLNQALAQVMARPDIQARFLATGSQPMLTSPQAFGALIRSDGDRWGRVIRQAGIRIE